MIAILVIGVCFLIWYLLNYDNLIEQLKTINSDSMSDKYTPGYVNVPGKGMRYRNAEGEYFDNHFGSIFNSFSEAGKGIGDAYNSYYDGVADAAGTERRDGTVTKPGKTPPTPPTPGLPANYKETEAKAIVDARRARGEVPGLPTNYKETESIYFPTQQVPEKTPPTPQAPNRGTEPAPDGNGASGTRLSHSPLKMEEANKLLKGGYTVGNPFTSNQLPATSASDYFQENSDYDLSRELPENMYSDIPLNLTSNVFDAGSGVEYGKNLPQFPASGQIEYLQKDGSPLTVSSGTFKVTEANESAQESEINKIPPRPRGGRQLQNWENKYERKVRAAEMAAERKKSDLEKGYKPDLARRNAFLDDDLNTFEAMRAVEAQKGVVYHKGQYNLSNPNAGQEGEPDFFIGTKEDRDIRLRGERTAQEFLDSRVKDITKSTNKTDDEEDNK